MWEWSGGGGGGAGVEPNPWPHTLGQSSTTKLHPPSLVNYSFSSDRKK